MLLAGLCATWKGVGAAASVLPFPGVRTCRVDQFLNWRRELGDNRFSLVVGCWELRWWTGCGRCAAVVFEDGFGGSQVPSRCSYPRFLRLR